MAVVSKTKRQAMEVMQMGFDGLADDPAWVPPPVVAPVRAKARSERPRAAAPAAAVAAPAVAAEAAAPPTTSHTETPSLDMAMFAPPAALEGLDAQQWAAWADRLNQHPDYRVLRRLVPLLDWGGLAAAGDAPPQRLKTVLILDTETTGLEAGKDRIIELALLRVTVDTVTGRPAGPVQVYDGLEDPGTPLPPAIVALTGLTDDQLRGHRLDMDRIDQLCEGVDLVVAHNAGFDRPFVEARCPGFAHLAWACSWADLPWKDWGHASAKLEALAADAGWFYDAHRAETDCHALLAVLSQAPQSRSQEAAAQTPWHHLFAAAVHPQHKLQATGAPFESKDDLKQRGYRWDAQQRVWGKTLAGDEALAQELAWLGQAVFGGRAVRVRVETLGPTQRFSARSGLIQMKAASASATAGG